MIRNNLKRIREQRKMNQRELAEACHTCQSLICDVERGQKATWPKLTERLCKVLDVKPEDIFPNLIDEKEVSTCSLAAPVETPNSNITGGDPGNVC